MTYRQQTYGGLLFLLLVILIISYVYDVPGSVVTPLIVLLAINLSLVEVSRYVVGGGKHISASQGWTYRQKHYTELLLGFVVNGVAVYFLPFPDEVWIPFFSVFIVNIIAIEIKHYLKKNI